MNKEFLNKKIAKFCITDLHGILLYKRLNRWNGKIFLEVPYYDNTTTPIRNADIGNIIC